MEENLMKLECPICHCLVKDLHSLGEHESWHQLLDVRTASSRERKPANKPFYNGNPPDPGPE